MVHEAFLSEGGERCVRHISQGIDETILAMETEAGRRSLEQAYRLVWSSGDAVHTFQNRPGLVTLELTCLLQASNLMM